MTKDEWKESYKKRMSRDIEMDANVKGRKASYLARAIGTANGAWLDPRFQWDPYSDDYISKIERKGSICGTKF